MEIRNALQKIENYLTVVSNLNKTILIEGTMSREELLLMKKYLYNSIDRIEDIEHLLVIDNNDSKDFIPNNLVTENKIIATPKQEEIVSTKESENLDEVESTLSVENRLELETVKDEIKMDDNLFTETVINDENHVFKITDAKNESNEIASINSHSEVITNSLVESNLTNSDEIENTIIEFNSSVEKTELTQIENEEIIPKINNNKEELIEVIKSDNLISNNIEKPENKLVADESVEVETIIGETKELSFLEQLQSTINNSVESLNDKFEQVKESTIIEKIQDKAQELTGKIEEKVTAFTNDNTFEIKQDKIEPIVDLVADETKKVETIINEKSEPSFLDKLQEKFTTTTINDKFEDKQENSFAEEILKNKKDNAFSNQSSFFDKLENKLQNEDPKKTFHLFEEEKIETVTDKLVSQNQTTDDASNQTISFVNDTYNAPSFVDTIAVKISKSLSESIALNDKFIFVRELFGNQFNEYDNALRILEKFDSYDASIDFCKENLYEKFNWYDKENTVERFNELLNKRFE